MSEIAARYRRLSDRFAERVAGVPDDRWTSPTPCAGWTARDLVRHVVESQGMFRGLAGREPGAVPDADADPVAAWDAARAHLQADLEDPALAGAELDGYLGRTRFDVAVDRFLCTDLVVHGWDLARATGQDETVDPDDAARTLENARGFGDAFRSSGAAGPEVPVPEDADATTRLLGFFGRRA